MGLREFNKKDDLPEELYHLDILDGSPPCSTFSMAGSREDAWGKEKKFREGQKMQTLDDLFFVFLETVEKLKPKIVIAENVTGLIKGNAKGYVNEIIKRFHRAGYEVQLFELNSAYMNVPQARRRVFFIANNQHYDKLTLKFNYKPINFGKVRSDEGKKYEGSFSKVLKSYKNGDRTIADIKARCGENNPTGFTFTICGDNEIHATLISAGYAFRGYDRMLLSDHDLISVSTFPQDYNFLSESPKYVCGMCVPPNMMANIASEIYKQWLS
jgi:DNA (cytosine-5)-methyltransferase 1